MFKKFLAFTMAEVLMVIAVIGITASLVLPNLTNDMEEKKVVSAVRKIYPEIETTYQAIISQHGKPPEWSDVRGSSDAAAMTTSLHNKFIEHSAILSNVDNSHVILKDGAYVTFSLNKMSDVISNLSTSAQNGTCTGEMGQIDVDINGTKQGENTNGRDIFRFYICYEEGIVPSGDSTDNGPLHTANGINTAWVIKAGNMDYLKCANDLNWNTKRTCK